MRAGGVLWGDEAWRYAVHGGHARTQGVCAGVFAVAQGQEAAGQGTPV